MHKIHNKTAGFVLLPKLTLSLFYIVASVKIVGFGLYNLDKMPAVVHTN